MRINSRRRQGTDTPHPEDSSSACAAQRGRDASRRNYSDDCDSEADDYYSYDTSKQLKTFRVNTMPPINEWVRVEDGVSFQRCAVRRLSTHCSFLCGMNSACVTTVCLCLSVS